MCLSMEQFDISLKTGKRLQKIWVSLGWLLKFQFPSQNWEMVPENDMPALWKQCVGRVKLPLSIVWVDCVGPNLNQPGQCTTGNHHKTFT